MSYQNGGSSKTCRLYKQCKNELVRENPAERWCLVKSGLAYLEVIPNNKAWDEICAGSTGNQAPYFKLSMAKAVLWNCCFSCQREERSTAAVTLPTQLTAARSQRKLSVELHLCCHMRVNVISQAQRGAGGERKRRKTLSVYNHMLNYYFTTIKCPGFFIFTIFS